MRQPKNSLMEDKMHKALSKTGLRGKTEASPEVVERTSRLRHRFKPRHSDTQTQVAVLEPPTVDEPTPSPEEINAALQSVTSAPDPQVQVAPETPSDIPSPAPIEEFSLSPAKPYLVAYMGKLRDARNVLAYDLEQANKHLEKYRTVLQSAQRDVDSAELSVLTLSDNIEKLDQNILECRKVEGMSLEIAALLPHGSSAHKKARPEAEPLKERMSHSDPRVCRKVDVLALLQAEPHRNWSAKEIVEALVPIKRSNGKLNVPCHLSMLNSEGHVVRVTKGVYTLAKAVETT